jgi:hypothetical protein
MLVYGYELPTWNYKSSRCAVSLTIDPVPAWLLLSRLVYHCHMLLRYLMVADAKGDGGGGNGGGRRRVTVPARPLAVVTSRKQVWSASALGLYRPSLLGQAKSNF